MEINAALTCLQALSQETRVNAFRLLARHEPDGLPAGQLAQQLKVPPNTLSAHLTVLSHAQLVTSRREGRSIIYRANLERIQDTIDFLVEDCCGGHPEICHPPSC
jgi:DNA-binding transcriptional ArsR family regulator